MGTHPVTGSSALSTEHSQRRGVTGDRPQRDECDRHQTRNHAQARPGTTEALHEAGAQERNDDGDMEGHCRQSRSQGQRPCLNVRQRGIRGWGRRAVRDSVTEPFGHDDHEHRDHHGDDERPDVAAGVNRARGHENRHSPEKGQDRGRFCSRVQDRRKQAQQRSDDDEEMDSGVADDRHPNQHEGEERNFVSKRHGTAPISGAVGRECRKCRCGQQEELEEEGDDDDAVCQVETRLLRHQVSELQHEDHRRRTPVPARGLDPDAPQPRARVHRLRHQQHA